MTKRWTFLSPTFAFPMGAVVLLTIVFMIYYLSWTARQERLLDGRAFRQLATASDQLQNRLNNYGTSLAQTNSLVGDIHSSAMEKHSSYIRDHVPGLQWEKCSSSGREPPIGPSIRLDNQQLHLQFKGPEQSVCAWASVEAAVLPFLQGGPEIFFDELVLADENGRVLYQTKKTGMRLASLGQLRRAAENPGSDSKPKENPEGSSKTQSGATGLIPVGAAAMSSTLAHDKIAGTDYRFYVVPVPLTLAAAEDSTAARKANLVLAGLFEDSRFTAEKFSMPGTVMVGGGLMLAIVIVSAWPLLKFSTMRATELIPRRAGLYYVLLSLVTSALAILLIVQVGFLFYQGDTDQRLKDLAASIDRNMTAESRQTTNMLQGVISSKQLREVATQEQLCNESPVAKGKAVAKEKTVDKARALALEGVNLSDYPYFHRLMWIDSSGKQLLKWEAGEQITPRITAENRPYVVETLQGNLWQLAEGTDTVRFRIDPVYSRNTGEYLAVVAQPFSPQVCPSKTMVATAVTPMLSLLNPVVPPDFGFAVVNPDGKVIFHSTAEKNDYENFLNEIDSDTIVKSAIFARQKNHLTASYHGAEHRLYVTPIDGIERCPWTLIVFRDLTPRRAQQLETILLFCCLTGGYYALLVIAGMALVRLPHYPGAWLWPRRQRAGEYYHLAITHTIAAASLCGMIFLADQPELLAAIIVIPASSLLFIYLKLRSREDEILLGAIVIWLAWLSVYLWNFDSHDDSRWKVMLLVTATLFAYVGLSIRGFTARMARWHGLKVENSFALAALTLVLILGILPCIGFFRLAHDHHAAMFTRREQLLTLQALSKREERVKHEYANLRLLEGKELTGLEETVKWLFLRRRLEDTRFDRYDRTFAIDAREMLIAHGADEARQSADGRMTRFLASLTSAFPNRDGEELRRLLMAPGLESSWIWERTGNYIRIRPRQESNGAGTDNSASAALNKIAAKDAVYLSPEIVSKVETLRLGSLPRGVEIPFILLMSGMFYWIRSTTRQLFLLNRRFNRPWPEFDPETTPVKDNLILIGLPCSGRTAWLMQKHLEVYRIDTVQLVRGTDVPDNISQPVVALDHFDYGTDQKAMQRKLETLEDLVLRRQKTVVIVTSANPVYHLTGGSDPESMSVDDLDAGGYGERWAKVLLTFTPMRLRPTCRPSSREYARVIWSTCSRNERVALYQLARGGWANYKNWAALEHLWQRGLVERTPVLRIADKDVREFVSDFVSPQEWKMWQRREGDALWDGLKLMFIVLIMGIAATALFMNQQHVLAYIVTGISALTPVTKLMSEFRIGGKSEPKP